MAHRVHNCQKAIEALVKVKDCKQKRNHIIDVLNGNIPVNEEEKQRLKRHRHCLRELVKKNTLDKKRKHLIQEEGFLGAQIPKLSGFVTKLLRL